MFRIAAIATVCCVLLNACAPPIRLIPSRVKTGLDSVVYAGVVEGAHQVDLRNARFLAKVKVGDLGVTLDCTYPDALNNAKDVARSIGGNLLVITEHKQYQEKSKCHRIKADIYAVPSLEGVESEIYWHPARPLLPGDMRGQPAPGNALPRLHCTFTFRLGGDFFKSVILRSETIFWADSAAKASSPDQAAFTLRRAQLHFNLAELHARRLKAALAAMGPDLPAITAGYRPLLAKQTVEYQAQSSAFEQELAAGSANADAVLERWTKQVQQELTALEAYFGDQTVVLKKQKKKG